MRTLKIPTARKYRKNMGAFGRTDVRRDESILDFSTAATCYNLDVSSGALRAGYGSAVKECVPDNATRYWVYRFYSDSAAAYVEQYVFQLANGLLRYYDVARNRFTYISGTPYPPIRAVNYRLNSADVLLMSCEGHRLIVWNGKTLKEYEDSPVISSMAIHYERLFVTSDEEPTKVFFSENLDPTNWSISADGGGFIELLDERGYLNKVVSFGSYLYIFRDHGISRVAAFGDQREFFVDNLFVTAGRIYPSSIEKCGAFIMFLASDGLYVFDGAETTRVLLTLDGLITPSDKCACAYFDGKYYLACGMDFRDGKTVGCESGEHEVNGLLVYDVATGGYSVSRGLDISYLSACSYCGEDFLMCCDGGVGGVIERNGMRMGESLPGAWIGPQTDFSAPDLTKSVRELYVKSAQPITVTMRSTKKTKTLNVRAGDRRVRVNFGAKRFSLGIEADAATCDVKPITLVYSTY